MFFFPDPDTIGLCVWGSLKRIVCVEIQRKNNFSHSTFENNSPFGVPGWLSRLSILLQLRTRSHCSWVQAPHQALCRQLRAWSLLRRCMHVGLLGFWYFLTLRFSSIFLSLKDPLYLFSKMQKTIYSHFLFFSLLSMEENSDYIKFYVPLNILLLFISPISL